MWKAERTKYLQPYVFLIQHGEVSRTSLSVHLGPSLNPAPFSSHSTQTTSATERQGTACRHNTEWATGSRTDRAVNAKMQLSHSSFLGLSYITKLLLKWAVLVMSPMSVIPIASPGSGYTYLTFIEYWLGSKPTQKSTLLSLLFKPFVCWSRAANKYDSQCRHSH